MNNWAKQWARRGPWIWLVLGLALGASMGILAQMGARPGQALEIVAEADESGLLHLGVVNPRGALVHADTRKIVPSRNGTPYRFSLPEGSGRVLALRVESGLLRLRIREMRVLGAGGDVLRNIPFQERYRIRGGMEAQTLPEGLQLDITGSEEPAVWIIELTERLEVTAPLGQRLLASWPAALAGLLMAAALWALAREGRATALREWIGQHPNRAIFITGALAALVSMWPIVLAQRSPVGPYAHGTYLYAGETTLPGQQHGQITQPPTYNVDVAALMYSAVGLLRQVAEQGEIMLWDRHNSSGTTYLGQGLVLQFSPYLLPVFLTGGQWAGWAAAFFLARLVACTCMGFYLRRVGISLPVSLAGVVVCAFLGVYIFRAAHFAYFVACAFPLYMLGLDGVLRAGRSLRARAGWTLVWLLGVAALLCSAAIKESTFTFAVTTLLVTGFRLTQAVSLGEVLRLTATSVVYGLALVLLSFPVLGTFLLSLGMATTVYDDPEFFQVPLRWFLGYFDEFFMRTSFRGYAVGMPGANPLLLPGLLFAGLLCAARGGWRLVALPLGLAVGCLFLAFRVVPAEIFVHVPFVRNIETFQNTFGIVALAPLFLAAALGWDFWLGRGLAGRAGAPSPRQRRVGLGVLLAFVLIFGGTGLLIGAPKPWPILAFGLALALCIWAFAWLAGKLAWGERLPGALARAPWVCPVLLVILAALLCVRLGWHANPRLAPYFFSLPERVPGQATSPAMDWVRQQTSREPGRIQGIHQTLSSGAPAYYGLEGIDGLMPLRNPHYWEFLLGIDAWEVQWEWRLQLTQGALVQAAPFLRFLNCRYVTTMPGQRWPEETAPALVHSSDLDIREVSGVWPRAFYAENVQVVVEGVPEFIERVRTATGPFCVVDPATAQAAGLTGGNPGNRVVPASAYDLQMNRTAFTVQAPGPGMLVLHEVHEPGVFQVRVNGEPTPYYRVNRMFRGIPVQAAGTYQVEYIYAPWTVTRGLWVMLGGAGLTVGLVLVPPLAARNRRPLP